ncbi:hypothetical protein [Inquilinus limosus]|uniref:Uncharacterized protein n=1 Tax=Inquilinus limosus MP06 TaxID=1398085 RepID=A0A0A0DDI1_9PROT|nr:hypothetical protein [Inquilinus limosus]KGM36174.1 hypothetical protein P409_00570 [Inquilinus limosus MP06]
MLTQAIDEYIAGLEIPSNIKDMISLARMDLTNGPVYLDAGGEPCSCFDPYVKRFDFSAATDQISTALRDLVGPIYLTEDGCWQISEPEAELDWFTNDDGEVEEIWVPAPDFTVVDTSQILARIVGPELVRYV